MSTERGFRSRLRAETRLPDVLAVLGVPVVLLFVFALPAGTRESLAFSAGSPTVPTAYTAHFVHLDPGHLWGNLAVYVLVVPGSYLLAALGGRRRIFFVPFVAVLLSFPFVFSALHLALDSPGRIVGFSGLNMAFVGMLPLFLTVYLSHLEGDVRLDHAPALFFAGVALIAFRVVPSGQARTGLALGAVLAALAHAVFAYRGLRSGAVGELVDRSGEFELVTGATVVFFLAVYLAFPSDPTWSGGGVDVYTHFLGYVVGFVVTYVVFRIDDPTLRIPSPPDEQPE
jgi:putative flippase GtrA